MKFKKLNPPNFLKLFLILHLDGSDRTQTNQRHQVMLENYSGKDSVISVTDRNKISCENHIFKPIFFK